MVRVLHVIPTLRFGGAERLVVDLCNHFDGGVVDSRICALRTDIPLAASLRPGLPPPIVLGCKGKDLCRLRNWLQILPLRRLLKEFRPDIVHTHVRTADLFGRLAGLYLPVRQVTTLHDVDDRIKGPTAQRVVTWALRTTARLASTRFAAISSAVADWYCGPLGVPREAIGIIPNGTDLERFYRTGAAADIDTASPLRLLCVGSFYPVKDHVGLIHATDLLRRRGLTPKLRLVGAGPLADALKSKARALNADGIVEFVPPLATVEREFAACDVFVLNSRSEGMGIVLIEAMASGRPVVATRVGGIPEVIRDGVDGFLVEPGRPDLLAEKIEVLARDPELRARMGTAGRQRAIDEFSIEKCARRYEAFYQETMARG